VQYAVVFREQGEPPATGSLELAQDRLLLTGGAGGHVHQLEVELANIVEIHVGRRPADRLNGYRTLVLERAHMPAVQIAPLEASLLHEIADLLATLTSGRPTSGDELAVVVPLKPDCLGRARQLLAHGPPLDPAALGLTSHHVYLREREAVFIFLGPDVEARVGRAMRSPALWRAGIAWQNCIAGRPRVDRHARVPVGEEAAYSWTAP